MADELQKIVPIVLVFIVAAIVMGFGAVVLSDIQVDFEEGASGTITDEAATVNDVADSKLSVYYLDSCAATVSTVINTTGRVLIESANYTVTNCSLIGSAALSEPYNGTGWTINYTYAYTDHPKADAIVSNGTETINTMGKYLPTLALIIVASLIIMLVLGAFYLGRR